MIILDAFTLEIEAKRVVGNLREGTFLEKSLLVIIFEAVGILRSKLMFFSSEKDIAKVSGETFLKIEKIKILFEKYLTM